MKFFLLILMTLSFNLQAKKFIHVHNGQIVKKYIREEHITYGGPWGAGQWYEIPEVMDLAKIKYNPDDGFYEDEEMSGQELADQISTIDDGL